MEQQTVSLKQCISETTGKQIVVNGKDFIYLDDKSKVESEVITVSETLKSQKEKVLYNEDILKQIEDLEKELIRPLSELLDTSSSQEIKDFAQAKVDDINIKKTNLRNQILS
jgi:hypothetical protein